MLSHHNLVANVYQILGPNAAPFTPADVMLCFLPLYHIYGLTVVLSLTLTLGATLVLMPRFDVARLCALLTEERVTMMPMVPPAINALCQAAEAGHFPREHKVRWIKSGAAPLAPDLARRLTALTNILVCQGYGMTEASPVTHVGFLDPAALPAGFDRSPLAQTDCRVLSQPRSTQRYSDDLRSSLRTTRRTGHARPAIHAGLLERATGDRRGPARRMVLVRGHRHARTEKASYRVSTGARK